MVGYFSYVVFLFTNVAEVCKAARKRTSSLTAEARHVPYTFCPSRLLFDCHGPLEMYFVINWFSLIPLVLNLHQLLCDFWCVNSYDLREKELNRSLQSHDLCDPLVSDIKAIKNRQFGKESDEIEYYSCPQKAQITCWDNFRPSICAISLHWTMLIIQTWLIRYPNSLYHNIYLPQDHAQSRRFYPILVTFFNPVKTVHKIIR